jgi:hypothetical protein
MAVAAVLFNLFFRRLAHGVPPRSLGPWTRGIVIYPPVLGSLSCSASDLAAPHGSFSRPEMAWRPWVAHVRSPSAVEPRQVTAGPPRFVAASAASVVLLWTTGGASATPLLGGGGVGLHGTRCSGPQHDRSHVLASGADHRR